MQLPFEADGYKSYQSAELVKLYHHFSAVKPFLFHSSDSLFPGQPRSDESLEKAKSTGSKASAKTNDAKVVKPSEEELEFAKHMLEFAKHLMILMDLRGSWTSAGKRRSRRSKFADILQYEYHPYIEVLIAFLLRRGKYPDWGAGLWPQSHVQESLTKSVRFRWSFLNEVYLALGDFEFFRWWQLPIHPDVSEGPLREIRSMARQFIEDLRIFCASSEVQQYFLRRLNSYKNVYDKTFDYAKSIVLRYRQCHMAVVELQMGGTFWDDKTIRMVAAEAGVLISQCTKMLKPKGLIGHAWKLDTTVVGKPVWRLRWLVWVTGMNGAPYLSAESVEDALRNCGRQQARKYGLADLITTHVAKPMCQVSIEDAAWRRNLTAIAQAQGLQIRTMQLIDEWVADLTEADLYRRIRVMHGPRPKMYGRGHVADGRVTKAKPVPWSKGGDIQLRRLWAALSNWTYARIGEQLGRSEQEIIARLVRLGICQSHAEAYEAGLRRERLHGG